MRNEERGRLDSAIDRAVRGMMQVDPPSGLRGRVADRIVASGRRTWMFPAFAAVTAAIVLAIAVMLQHRRDVAPAPQPQLASAPAVTPVESAPQTPPPVRQQEAPAAGAAQPRAAQTPAPRPASESIFGERTDRVSATNVAQGTPQKPGSAGEAPAKSEFAGEPVNIKLDVTFTDHTDGSEPVKKTVTIVVADRGAGSVRSVANVPNQGRVAINVEARPLILPSGGIRTILSLEYSPRLTGSEGPTEATTLNQQITTIIAPNKPVIVSQAADPGSDRKITVEVRASLVK